MTDREQYTPGPAGGAQVQKDGEKWTLILVRDLRHSAEKVWQALTDPVHLREWAPFEADGNLGTVGTVKLTWVGAPAPQVFETSVTRADAPKRLKLWLCSSLGMGYESSAFLANAATLLENHQNRNRPFSASLSRLVARLLADICSPTLHFTVYEEAPKRIYRRNVPSLLCIDNLRRQSAEISMP